MIYLLLALLAVILIWLFMVWIRKTMWDAVNRNLIDLEDKIEGRVTRAGFGSRPIFHGTFEGRELTINFSSERKGNKRLTYVDISYATTASVSFTIAEKSWLEAQQAGPLEDYSEWTNEAGQNLILRPASEAAVHKIFETGQLQETLQSYSDLAYLFVGPSGLIYEFITEEVIKSTEADALLARLKFLETIRKAINS